MLMLISVFWAGRLVGMASVFIGPSHDYKLNHQNESEVVTSSSLSKYAPKVIRMCNCCTNAFNFGFSGV